MPLDDVTSAVQNEAVFGGFGGADFLPDDANRSGLAGEALVLAAAEGDEAEYEAGEAEDDAEGDDQDRRSAAGGRVARVEELRGGRHC